MTGSLAGTGADQGALPLELALSSVLAARLDGAARPALLAAVARIPAQRGPLDDVLDGDAQDRRS
jgi:hypothetical protein